MSIFLDHEQKYGKEMFSLSKLSHNRHGENRIALLLKNELVQVGLWHPQPTR